MGVSRLLGKLFGSDPGKTESVLRAYGKLPMYAEYRRLEVAPGAPTLFSQWMDAGRLAWVKSPTKSDHGVTRSSRVMFRPPSAKEVVVASIRDSRDSLGRVFPFAFFVVCPVQALGATSLQRWASALSIHERFDRLHTELGALTSGGNFYRLYQKRVIKIRPDDFEQRVEGLMSDARCMSIEEWFRAAMPNNQVSPGEWLAGLDRRGRRWKAQPGLVADIAMSFPLAKGFSHAAQVALWMQWIDGVLSQAKRPAWVIAPADGIANASSLNLIVRDVLPDDFQLLTTDDTVYDFVEKMANVPPGSDDAEPSPAPVLSSAIFDWAVEHAP